MQKRYRWKLKQREILFGDRTLLMGVLNLPADSDPDRAFSRGIELEDEGADILGISAESMQPGSLRIPEAEELRRLVPVLKRLQGKLTIPICVDTYKSGVSEKALEHGAEIINDPSGILLDLQLPKMVTKYDAGLIVNHTRGKPDTWAKLPPMKDLMRSIMIDLEAALHRARQAGVQKQQIAIDPGLGFGKRQEQNSEILANLKILETFDVPILVSPSHQFFLKNQDHASAEFVTAGAVAASILNGAHIIRVHDVKAIKTVAEVADTIRQAAYDDVEQTPVQTRWHRGQ
jgi:dihydropteroate synthase